MKRFVRILLLAVAGVSLAAFVAVRMSFITGRWISLPLNDAPFASHRVRYEVGLNGRGMHFYRGQSDTIEKYAIPHWALAGIALLAVWGSSLMRKRPGILPGRCARCGYDLRATPGRCPELGRRRRAPDRRPERRADGLTAWRFTGRRDQGLIL